MKQQDGIIFGTVLKAHAITGLAQTVEDIKDLPQIDAGEHEIQVHDDGLVIHEARRRLSRAIGIKEKQLTKGFNVLFGPGSASKYLLTESEQDFENKHRLMQMNFREVNAFTVNNYQKFIKIFKDIDSSDLGISQVAEIEEVDWYHPRRQDYRFHKKTQPSQFLNKNVFQQYGDNILIYPNRSQGEIAIELWAENNPIVRWIYKNGDKGTDFFSIAYQDGLQKKMIYPDYIIKLIDGTTWIIEVKGGVTASDESQNIDKSAKNKFNALKQSGERHPEVKVGFARPVGGQLYISTEEWSEPIFARQDIWKPIDEVVLIAE